MQSLKSGTWPPSLSGDLGILYGHHTGTSAARRGTQYISISSTGNATDYVDLTDGYTSRPMGWGTATRGGIAGGVKGNDDSSAKTDRIEYHVMASSSHLTHFGDLSVAKSNGSGLSNGTRAVYSGGHTPTALNVMEYITVASVGDVTDFGDLSTVSHLGSSASGTTRGMIHIGNSSPGQSSTLTMEYITVGSTGNTTDFGDSTDTCNSGFQFNSSVRMVHGVGEYSGTNNILEYYTITSTGNATDFGDLTSVISQAIGTGNATRGVRFGGTAPGLVNVMDYITFGSAGNATDFGDLLAATYDNAAASDCHGGLP